VKFTYRRYFTTPS